MTKYKARLATWDEWQPVSVEAYGVRHAGRRTTKFRATATQQISAPGAPSKERAMSITEHTSIPSLDATIERFLQTLTAQGGPPLYTLAPAEARAALA